DPRDGQHGVVLLAGGRWIAGVHAFEHLPEHQRLAIAGKRQSYLVYVGRTPNVAIPNSAEDGMLPLFFHENTARALLAMMAVMVDPGLSQHLAPEATVPLFAVPTVARVSGAGLQLEGVGRGTQSDNRAAGFHVIYDVSHLAVG